MRLEIHPGPAPWTVPARTLLARTQRRLAARVRRYDLEPATLQADFGDDGDGGVDARMALETALGRVEVRATEADVTEAVRAVAGRLFEALDARRLGARRALLEHRWGPAESVLDSWLRGGPSFQQTLLEEGLASLERAAAWELARLQVEEDLEPGLVLPEDVVAEVLAEELAHVDPELGVESTVAALQDRVIARVQDHAAELRSSPITLDSIDEELPPAALLGDEARAVSLLDTDLMDFWEPDVLLHLEDVLGASLDDPDAVVSDAEARHNLVQALFVLAPASRRLVEQRVVDGLSLSAVSSHEHLRPDEVEQAVEEALVALGEMLGEERPLPPEEVRGIYAALGELLRGERAARTAELVRFPTAPSPA